MGSYRSFWCQSQRSQDCLTTAEQFDTVVETKALVDRYRKQYNTVRPHSSLGYRPPAPEAFAPWPLSTEVPSPYTGLTW